MLKCFVDVQQIDIFDPYKILPIERIVTCLGERR
jgi:hypothetical protein